MPCFVFERCCASYFLSDYEKRSRYYIGIFLLSASAGSGFILSYLYHKCEHFTLSITLTDFNFSAESTLIYHTIALVFNMTFSIILVIVEKYNYKRLRESSNLRKSKREYSLAERFQISENIRVCEVRKKKNLKTLT